VTYRCYLLTKENKIHSFIEVDSETDAAAFLQAGTLIERTEEHPSIEIWKGERLVGRLPHLDGTRQE
jgi:hypothetical protein